MPGFTSSTNVTKLVYYEEYATMEEAIAREKQIKGGSRKKKIDLIRLKQSNNYFDVYIHIVRSVTGCHVRYNRHAVEFNGDIFIKVK